MRLFLLALTLSLSACGFHLRGHDLQSAAFPFKSLYLKYSAQTPFITDLQNNLQLYKITLATSSEQADLTLDISGENSSKKILALSGAGQVLEYELRYRVSLRAYDKQMQEWMPADEILLLRTLTYDATQILAKEQEEVLLYRDMRSDAVQQIMRRLSRAKPRLESANTEPAQQTAPLSAASSPAAAGTLNPGK